MACILAEKPDVALVDIALPGMDGYEVAQRVRAELGHSVLLVAMTGYGAESEQLKALSAGFDMHMTKPIGVDLVDRVLETLLQRNASARALPVVAAPAIHSRVQKVEGRRDVKAVDQDSVTRTQGLVAAIAVDDE